MSQVPLPLTLRFTTVRGRAVKRADLHEHYLLEEVVETLNKALSTRTDVAFMLRDNSTVSLTPSRCRHLSVVDSVIDPADLR